MAALLILLILTLGLGASALLGLTTDSRDPDFSLAHVFESRRNRRRPAGPTGTLPTTGPRSSADRAAAF